MMVVDMMITSERSGSGWVILRTAPASTLRLATSLRTDGFETWTPIHVLTTPKTRRRAEGEREAPLMPSFVFAAANDLPRLSALRARAEARHPTFSIFRHAGRIPVIADASLSALRILEERETDRREAKKRRGMRPPAFAAGQAVTSTDQSFAGLEGVVEGQDGKFVLVCFGGRYAFKISAWLLRPTDVLTPLSAAA